MSGYSERNWEDAFISRNYIIREGERNYEQSPFEGGMVHVEELLELDYMRHPGNILDSVFHDHFTVVEKEKYVEDGRHILVIGFECSSPQFVFSGDAQIEELNGEIHLVQNDMSIQHFKATYQSAGRFRHGRAFMVDEELKNDSIEYVDYTVETDYGRVHDDRMAVKRIQMDVDRHLLDHAQPETSSYEITFDDLLPGEKNVDENHRHYYDNVSELLDEE